MQCSKFNTPRPRRSERTQPGPSAKRMRVSRYSIAYRADLQRAEQTLCSAQVLLHIIHVPPIMNWYTDANHMNLKNKMNQAATCEDLLTIPCGTLWNIVEQGLPHAA